MTATKPPRTPLRYAAPNLVTALAMLFGLAAMVAATTGDYVFAGWMIVWATFLDRLDGVVARLLRATSEFGVQMDSFADFFNFGIAPAFLIYTALTAAPGLPYASGRGHALIAFAAVAWIFACTFRLARFNVIAEEPRFKGLYFGVPTTVAAGTLVTWFLVLLKYASPENPLQARGLFPEGHILSSLALPAGAWIVIPWAMLLGALLMVANMRVRKLSLNFRRPFALVLSICALIAVAFGFSRIFPELMVLLPTSFIVYSLVAQVDPALRKIEPPPLLPIGKA